MITALLQQKKSEAQRHQVTAGKGDVGLRCLVRYHCATSVTWRVAIQEKDRSQLYEREWTLGSNQALAI